MFDGMNIYCQPQIDPFEEGCSARRRGEPWINCPHYPANSDRSKWMRGWNAVHRDLMGRRF